MRHWRGEQSLARAFWVDLVALRALVFAAQEAWQGAVGESRGLRPLPVALALLAAHGALFVWQTVGVVRAAEEHVRDSGSQAGAFGAWLGIVALFCLTLAYALEGYQTTLAPAPDESFAERTARERAAGYTLGHVDGERALRLDGPVAAGVTRRMRTLLDEHPEIERIVLDSTGGNVHEGRGLARLFRERGLTTRIDSVCASACAVAFIGGARRVLGPNARLGLHRYRMDGAHAIIVTDTAREQQRDERLYAKAGVAAWFVERMFDVSAAEMWWPRPEELLRAGVVHELERRRRGPP